MDNINEAEEDSFSSDQEYDSYDEDSGTSTDVDAKLAEDDVFDIEFFKCYTALKKKDDKIYDQKVKFFSKDDESERGHGLDSKTIGPKMTLLDHQLSLKDDEIEEPSKNDLNKPVSKSFYEKELDEIKKSIEKISEDVESGSDDDLLIVKKSEASKIRKKTDQDIDYLKQLWPDPDNLTEEERYLRDYILNKRYLPAAQQQQQQGFFSKNLDELSDIEDTGEETKVKTKRKADHHSDEKDFDKIVRVPRNSTKTIRDLAEKRKKKERRSKKIEKLKKKKKVLKDADFEDIVGDLTTRFHYRETEPNDYGLSAEELVMATEEELDQWVKVANKNRNDLELKRKIFRSIYGEATKQPTKRTKKRKRGVKTGVAPDRLLAYGISKKKLKKSKLL